MTPQWLERVLAPGTPFALLHRPTVNGPERIELLLGETSVVERIADIPLPADAGPGRHDVLVALPYRQIAERGFAAPDDGTPLTVLTVGEQRDLGLDEVLDTLPDDPIDLADGRFDVDDDAYAATVRDILAAEIGRGTGANFVLKRSFEAVVRGWSARTALSFFRRLLGRATGSYWTFVVSLGDRFLIGATPERHVSLDRGLAVMNPISGTHRYPELGLDLAGLLAFLSDHKEAGELAMVLDEELKMMSRVCPGGACAIGPRVKPMARLAHTEYLVEGHSELDVREILHQTIFAPTVVGGPLESACRVVARYEPQGRGYYAGVLALLGRDEDGRQRLDSAIVIRTADVDARGRLVLPVGATIVRDSNPLAEAAETRAKAEGLLDALTEPVDHRGGAAAATAVLCDDVAVRRALAGRNAPLAPFWFRSPRSRRTGTPRLAGYDALVVDAEDNFTAMIGHILSAIGCRVEVRRFDEAYDLAGRDLVVLGPGPGDPRDAGDPKIAHMRDLAARLLRDGTPTMGICLGHQVFSAVLGLEITRLPTPRQGVQRTIDLFGRARDVGFYNTFVARCATARLGGTPRGELEVCAQGGEVHALRGPGFASVQFHPESVLSRDGSDVLEALAGDVLASSAAAAAARPRSA